MSVPLNPTQLTPPRVAFIDDRTGAISREWYRFFLSLLTATQTNQQETQLAPDTSSLLASYDAVFTEAIDGLESAPDCCSETASLSAEVNELAQTTGVVPPAATESALAVIQSQLQALALAPPPKEYRTPRYGSFYDTTDQTAAVINTAYAMTFNTTDLSFGVTRGITTSRISVDRPNIYNIQFSAQLINTAGGAHRVWIWLRKNGTDVADSATAVRLQGNNAETVAAWNFLLQMNAGDYFELMWEVDNLAVSLYADPATGVHPAIPSIILTVTDNVSSLEV
jgi:uncharacterized protein (DUF736 family)